MNLILQHETGKTGGGRAGEWDKLDRTWQDKWIRWTTSSSSSWLASLVCLSWDWTREALTRSRYNSCLAASWWRWGKGCMSSKASCK